MISSKLNATQRRSDNETWGRGDKETRNLMLLLKTRSTEDTSDFSGLK